MKNLAIIILAAGKSTRMKSEIPKALHPVCGRPMLEYVLDLAKGLKAKKVIAVLGSKQAEVKKLIGSRIKTVVQNRPRGTADAVKKTLPLLKSFSGTVLVLYGDMPLVKKETLKKLLAEQQKNNFDAVLLTAQVSKPDGYGRVLRDKYAGISAIIEEKDADDFQKNIREINTGIVCFKKDKLGQALKQVRPNNRKREFYLTDALGILYKKGALIADIKVADINEALGINSRLELAKANNVMQQRINEELMKNGITIVDPASAFIGYGAKIGQDTTIYPFTVIENNVKIGKRCLVGPFIHLRAGSRIEDGVVVGNFLEIARSRLAKNTLVKHFGYLGDSIIGRQVNIGAGTVTANFDGKNKNTTVVKDNAFIGSDTVLVAPVKVGRGARTGAGSVILKRNDVKDNSVVAGVPARPLRKTVK